MNKSTLVALAVFAALALAFVLTREPKVSEGVQKLTLAPVNPDAVAGIELGSLSLASRDGGWTVAESTSKEKVYQADKVSADALARELSSLKADDLVTDRAERHAELEVDAAKGVTVKVLTPAGTARELIVGKASKSGGVYVRQPGVNAVFNARSGVGYQVHRALKDWRDKHIDLVAGGDVVRVQVSPATGTSFTFANTGNDWKLETPAPAGFRFDPDAAAKLVSQLTSLSAQDFVDSDDGLKTPSTITVTTKAGLNRTLTVGTKRADATSAVTVDGAQQVWIVQPFVADLLRMDLEGVRDLRPLRVDEKEIEQVTVAGSKGRAVVKRDGATWKLVEPKTLPAGFEFDSNMVQTQLKRLLGTRATRVAHDVPVAKAGLGSPTVELKLKGGAADLRFGGSPGTNEVYARGNDEFVYVMAAPQKSWLEAGLDLFKKPPPMPQNMGGIQGLDQLPPDIRAKLEAQLRQQQQQ